MAMTKMICAFSGNLCKDCALYRGRHYYLCFCDKYRGHLDELGDSCGNLAPPASGLSTMRKFEIPSFINARGAIDPYGTDTFCIVMEKRGRRVDLNSYQGEV